MKRLVIDVHDEVHTKFKLLAFSQGLTMKQLLERILMDFMEDKVHFINNDDYLKNGE